MLIKKSRPILLAALIFWADEGLTAQCSTVAISDQPGVVTSCAGGGASFGLITSNATTWTWYVTAGGITTLVSNGAIYSGATTSQLTLSDIPVSYNGNIYYCVVSNGCSQVTTNNMTLTVNSVPLPTVSVSGPDTGCSNTMLTFMASVTNAGAGPSYQWTVNGDPQGADANSIALILDGGSYSITCTVGELNCSLLSVSNTIVLTVFAPVKPALYISGPTSICADSAVYTTSVTAGGADPAFQWFINEEPAGNTSTITLFPSPTASANDILQCTMTSDAACANPPSVTSNTIAVTVPQSAGPPSVTVDASATTICAGTPVTFTAIPNNGGTTPAYQWQINGTDVGPDSSTWTSTTLKNEDIVSVILTSSLGCTSPVPSQNTIPMTVNPMPVVTMMADTIIQRGASAMLHAGVQGNIAGYQWSPPTGLDNAIVAMPVATPDTTTTYQLTVTTDSGCRVSGKVKVDVYSILVMPNAFTPDGDGKNDVFRIPPSIGINMRSFIIFDRWGAQVFSTQNSAIGWDGTLDGHSQPPGVYVWTIEWQSPQTGQWTFSRGTVILVR
jgi:gliding motility-associated-like protein